MRWRYRESSERWITQGNVYHYVGYGPQQHPWKQKVYDSSNGYFTHLGQSSIYDDNDPSDKKKVKECYHKRHVTILSAQSAFWKDGASYISVDKFYGPLDRTDPVLPEPPDLDYQAVNSITPKLKASMSLPNFLFELKDLRKVIPTSQQLQRISAALIAVSTNPFKGGRKWGAKELHNAAAGQHLSAQFGYLPLIDDAYNLVSSIEAYNYSKRDFERYANKPQVGYFKKYLPETIGARKYGSTNVGPSFRYYTQDNIISDVITYGIKYTYSVDAVAMKSPALFYKYMGFRANPRILWDAIPFSFIVDWMIGVGKFLEQFDAGAVPVKMNIISCWKSRKTVVKRIHGFEAVPHPTGRWITGPGIYATTTFTIYRRGPWVPTYGLLDSLDVIQQQKLTRNKVTLATSLGKVLTHKG